jgi:hypothetical protein
MTRSNHLLFHARKIPAYVATKRKGAFADEASDEAAVGVVAVVGVGAEVGVAVWPGAEVGVE